MMRSKVGFLFFIGFPLWIRLWFPLSFPMMAYANTEETVHGVYQQGVPYLVVVADEKGMSRREPGIYTRDSAGEWTRILSGTILSGRTSGAVREQLEITKLDRRFESLVVVDGLLTIFHIKSDEGDRASLLKLGTSELPLIDVVTKQSLHLPPITDADDLSVCQAELSENAQMILFSVRAPTPLGEGVTFGLLLKAGTTDEKRIELVGTPHVLDYEFHPYEKLRALIHSRHGISGVNGVISTSFVRMLTHPDPRDPPVVKQWREKLLSDFLNREADRSYLPFYDFSTGSFSVLFPPQVTWSSVGQGVLFQIYDLLEGQDGLFFSKGRPSDFRFQERPDEYLMRGRLNILPSVKDGYYHIYYNGAQNHDLFLFFLDKILYVGFVSGSGDNEVSLEVLWPAVKTLPEKFTYYVLQAPGVDPAVDVYYLLVSSVTEGEAKTELFHIAREKRDGRLRRSRKVTIANEFFTGEELAYRVKSDDKKRIFFDTLTSRPGGDALPLTMYKQTYRETRPHLDLDRSEEGRSTQGYLKPLREEKVFPNGFYREFDSEGAQERLTGIYIHDNNTEIQRIEGELLFPKVKQPEKEEGMSNPLLSSETHDIPDFASVTVSAAAIDKTFEGGRTSFTLLLHVSSKTSAAMKPVVHSVSLALPFERLKDVKLFFGKKGYSNTVYLFCSVAPAAEAAKNEAEAGVYAMVFEITSVEKGHERSMFVSRKQEMMKISKQSMSDSDEIKTRICFEETGAAYWILTPEFPYSDPNFSLFNLTDRSRLTLNTNDVRKRFRFGGSKGEGEDWRSEAGYENTWRLYGPYDIPNAKELLARAQNVDVLPSIGSLLNSLADEAQPAEHRVLLVPDELSNYVYEVILRNWIDPRSSGLWRVGNPHLNLFHFDPKKAAQKAVFQNFSKMKDRGSDDRKPVLFAKLSDVMSIGRPSNHAEDKETFHLTEVSVRTSASGDQGLRGELGVSEELHLPHLLYLFSTEGRPIALNDLQKFPDLERKVSILLLGTKQEWETLQGAVASLEGRIGLAERFQVDEVSAPDLKTRIQLLTNVLNRPEISGIGYRFDAAQISRDGETLTSERARDQVLGYMAARCDLLATQGNQDRFSAFVRFLNLFAAALVNDPTVRKSRVLNRVFAENLLSQVFSMPLNLATLPEDDPLVILSQPDVALRLQQAGYAGPFALKTQVINAVLGQTRRDTEHPIPASVLIFGETRTGKTYLFRCLVNMLGLKMYDFNAPPQSNQDAQAIIISVGTIVPDEATSKSPNALTVSEAKLHLNYFLSLPKGNRGFILFDDVHAASDEVRGELLTAIRALFESPNGIFMAMSPQRTAVERSIRNLTIFMTLNPPSDYTKIERFKADKGKPAHPLDIVLASLSGEKVQVERSFLMRWSLILNLSEFPAEAKGPKLTEAVVSGSQDAFNNQGRFILISREAIGKVVDQFSSQDAGTFLSTAPRALFSQVDAVAEPMAGGIFVVVPGQRLGSYGPRPSWRIEGPMSGSGLEHYVASNIQALPVQSSLDGKLQLLHLMVDTFRTGLYEAFTEALNANPQFALQMAQQKHLLAPALSAIERHLSERPSVPLVALPIDSFDFGAQSSAAQADFRNLLGDEAEAKTFFPIRFEGRVGSVDLLSQLTSSASSAVNGERMRAHVLAEISDRLHRETLSPRLARILHVDSLDGFPDPEEWSRQLKVDDFAANLNEESGLKLARILVNFLQELFDNGLLEQVQMEQFERITTYDAVRLFLITLDKAITRLPWTKALFFSIGFLELATKDMVIGQSPGVQHYLFQSKTAALLRPVTQDALRQMLVGSPAFDMFGRDLEGKLAERFKNRCERMLLQGEW